MKTYKQYIANDKAKENDFQDFRNTVTLGIVSDMRHYDKHIQIQSII